MFDRDYATARALNDITVGYFRGFPLWFGLSVLGLALSYPSMHKPDDQQLSRQHCQIAATLQVPTIGFCRINGNAEQKAATK